MISKLLHYLPSAAGELPTAAPLFAAVLLTAVPLTAAVLLVAAPLGCGGNDDQGGPVIRHPQDFMVYDVEGWDIDAGSLDTATTIDELRASAVDGDGHVYELHNFQEWAGAFYAGTVDDAAATLTLWIFELQSVNDALAIYHDSENGIEPPTSEEPDQVIGDEARIWQDGLFYKVLDFVRGCYWVKLSINNLSDNGESVLQVFGASVDQKIVD